MPRKFLVLVLGAAAIAAALWFFTVNFREPSRLQIIPTETVTINEISVRVALADTPVLREQGLSGVAELAPDEGILFVFQEDGRHSFWMKDMLVSIDIIWFDADKNVVHLERSVSPDSYPRSFTSSLPARYVLEVPAGFASEHEIEVGTRLDFSL